MAKKRKLSRRWIAKKHGFRSGFEMEVFSDLKSKNVKFQYESIKLEYEVPSRKSKYTPDFILDNGIIIESKGRLLSADRKKMLLVKEQHPDLDIRFLFQNAGIKLNKNSKTTYADWCEKHGFKYAEKTIPKSWIS